MKKTEKARLKSNKNADLTQTLSFLQAHYDNEKLRDLHLVVTTTSRKGKKRLNRWFDIGKEQDTKWEKVLEFVKVSVSGGRNVYLNINPRVKELAAARAAEKYPEHQSPLSLVSGTAAEVGAVVALVADVDYASEAHKQKLAGHKEVSEALSKYRENGLAAELVRSGGGFYSIVLLQEPIMLANAGFAALASGLSLGYHEHLKDYGVKPDPTADITREIRMPGTINWKYEEMPTVLVTAQGQGYTVDELVRAFPQQKVEKFDKRSKIKKLKLDGLVVELEERPSDPQLVIERCGFLKWGKENPNDVGYDEWLSGITILSRCTDGPDAAHEWSSGYEGYDAAEVDGKIFEASKMHGPRTCGYVQQHLTDPDDEAKNWCEGCDFRHLVKSPITLGDEELLERRRDQKEQEDDPDRFWVWKRSQKTGEKYPWFDPEAMCQWLEEQGWRLAYDSKGVKNPVRLQGRIVHRYHSVTGNPYFLQELKDVVTAYVKKMDLDAWVWLVTKGTLRTIDNLKLFYMPKKDVTAFYFQDCMVKVTDGQIQRVMIEDLDHYIYAEDMMPRTFSVDESEGTFERFINRAIGARNLDVLRSSIGYLMSMPQVSQALRRIIVMLDGEESETDEGGRGKSLMMKAVGHMVSTGQVSAVSFRASNRFALQDIDASNRVVVFDDATRKFPITSLRMAVTEGLTVEKKGQGSFQSEAGLVITANQLVSLRHGSDIRRVHLVPFLPHYSKDHTPLDEDDVGTLFEWDQDGWNRFTTWMLGCVALYQEKGLVKADSIKLRRKVEAALYPAGFLDWADKNLKLTIDHEPADTIEDLRASAEADGVDLNDRDKPQLGRLIKRYCDGKGWIYTSKQERSGGGKRPTVVRIQEAPK